MAKVFGIDEVGRGALSGPVVSCCFYTELKEFDIRDLKGMSQKKREEIYSFLKRNNKCWWGTGRVSEKVIDKINILQATKLSMERAVSNLEKQIGKANLLLIDGNFGIDVKNNQKSIIKGDESIFQIKLASIVAKVERDRMMVKYHKMFPLYGFCDNKGYGTRFHIDALSKIGPCEIHRTSFAPIRKEK